MYNQTITASEILRLADADCDTVTEDYRDYKIVFDADCWKKVSSGKLLIKKDSYMLPFVDRTGHNVMNLVTADKTYLINIEVGMFIYCDWLDDWYDAECYPILIEVS